MGQGFKREDHVGHCRGGGISEALIGMRTSDGF